MMILHISEGLKEATAENHQSLEKMIVDQIGAIRTRKDYIFLLGLFYSYFGALETNIGEHISSSYLPDIHERRKTNLISQDLSLLAASHPQKTASKLLPAILNRYQAFGALYVIEGSTLGGIHITRMITKKLPEVSKALRFFEGYGDQTVDMWKRFKSSLDNLSGNQKELDGIISAAQDTFLKFAEWIIWNTKSNVLI